LATLTNRRRVAREADQDADGHPLSGVTRRAAASAFCAIIAVVGGATTNYDNISR
jgi:hypothetical protein